MKRVISYKKTSLKLLLVVASAAFVIWSSSSLQEIILRYSGLITVFFQEHESLGIFIFLSVSVVSVVISPFSSLPLIPSVIMVWGNLVTFTILVAGWFFGAWLGYLLGGWAGRKVLRHWWDFEKVEYYKEKISPRAQFWLVFLFRLAIPSEITGITLGIIRYQLGKYLLITFLTELPFAFAAVYLGRTLAKGDFLAFAAMIILVTALIALASYFFHKKINEY